MTHRTSLHVLLTCIFVLATIAACAVSSGSPALAPAVAPEAASVDPVPAERVLGEWTGVYFVYPDAMELTLQLTYDGGTLGDEADFRPMFERRRAMGTVEGRVRLTGIWDPDTRTFSLSPAEWIERPRTAGATAFHWEGVLDATRPALAGRLVTPRSTAEGTQVYFTLSRPDAAGSIRDGMAVRAPSRSFLHGLMAGGPEACSGPA